MGQLAGHGVGGDEVTPLPLRRQGEAAANTWLVDQPLRLTVTVEVGQHPRTWTWRAGQNLCSSPRDSIATRIAVAFRRPIPPGTRILVQQARQALAV
ncbi:hypothetical protein D3C81_1130250 [compost metagenome]